MQVELDYPRDMSIWRHIGYHIDSAFQYKDGKVACFLLALASELYLTQFSFILTPNILKLNSM